MNEYLLYRIKGKTLSEQKTNYNIKQSKSFDFIVIVLIFIVEFKTLMFNENTIAQTVSRQRNKYAVIKPLQV